MMFILWTGKGRIRLYAHTINPISSRLPYMSIITLPKNNVDPVIHYLVNKQYMTCIY